MGAASTFIKEGIRHISVVQRMAPWGVMNDTVIHLAFVCVCVYAHSVWHAHICAPSPSSCVSQRSRQMFRRSHAIGLVLTVVYFSPLSRRGPIASVLINTRRSLANKYKVGCFGCGLLRVAPLLFCLFVMFFFQFLTSPPNTGFHLSFSQPAYRLLYYSWTPYCFWLMQKTCSPSYTTYTTYSPHTSTLRGLIYNLAGLNLKITAGFHVHN